MRLREKKCHLMVHTRLEKKNTGCKGGEQRILINWNTLLELWVWADTDLMLLECRSLSCSFLLSTSVITEPCSDEDCFKKIIICCLLVVPWATLLAVGCNSVSQAETHRAKWWQYGAERWNIILGKYLQLTSKLCKMFWMSCFQKNNILVVLTHWIVLDHFWPLSLSWVTVQMFAVTTSTNCVCAYVCVTAQTDWFKAYQILPFLSLSSRLSHFFSFVH